MKEKYLHFVWRLKRFTTPFFNLSDGRIVKIIRFGTYNSFENGPDFYDGCIEIEGIQYFGPIEMHVNASDWYKHQHQNDKNYQNVILHVVYNADESVCIDQYSLPTLEISSYIDNVHLALYNKLNETKTLIPCSKLIKPNYLDVFYQEDLLFQRFMRKSKICISENTINNPNLFYFLFMNALGRKINANGFDDLAKRYFLKFLDASKQKVKAHVKDIIDTRICVSEIQEATIWKTKGFYPKSNPIFRLNQWAEIDYSLMFNQEWVVLSEKEIIEFFTLHLNLKLDKSFKFSKQLINHLLINAVVPFLFCLSEINEDEAFQAKGFDLLLLLPPEQNRIIDSWKSLGFVVNSSYDTQSILELHNNKCMLKDCLNCKIGLKVLTT